MQVRKWLLVALVASALCVSAFGLDAERASEMTAAMSPPPPSTESGSSEVTGVPASADPVAAALAHSVAKQQALAAGAAPAEDSDSGQITIIDNSNDLKSLMNMRKKEMLAEANQREQKLKAALEDHQKHLEAFQREQKAEAALKTEQAAKKKIVDAAEEGDKKKVQEAQDKTKQEQDVKQQAENSKAEEAKTKTEHEESTKSQASTEAASKKTENEKTYAEEQKRKESNEQAVKKLNNVKLENNYQNYGNDYDDAYVRKEGNIVFVQGLVTGPGGLIATLPAGYRPTDGRLIFALYKGSEARVDVLADGRIYHVTAGSASWVSLNGIIFDTTLGSYLDLSWGWVPYGGEYRRVTQSNVNDLCVISGLIRSGSWNYFARTMQACWPNDGQLIFSGNNHDHITRVDVRSDGYVFRDGGYADNGWVSLDGIVYSGSRGADLGLQNNWSHYYSGYRIGNWRKIGNVCVLGGLIRNPWWNDYITQLPQGCRPRKRLIFGANVHDYNCRIDIFPNGDVRYIDRRSQWDWVSLSGIAFIAYN